MIHTLLLTLGMLFFLNACADYANATPTIGYGVEAGGAVTNSEGSGVYGATTVENGEVGGMVAVDSGFMRL